MFKSPCDFKSTSALILLSLMAAGAVGIPVPDQVSICHEGYTYTYHKTPMTWDDAEGVCASNGGHLASVHDSLTGALLFTLSGRNAKRPVHLGGRLIGGSWCWMDGSDFDFTNWLDNEPNNFTSREFCLAMGHAETGTGAQWNDRNCGTNQASPFICMAPVV